MSAFSCRIVHNRFYSLRFLHNPHKSVARTRDSAHVLLPCQNTAFLRGLKIIEYIQYIDSVRRQDVHQRSHETEMASRSLLVTCLTVSLIIFMVSAHHEYPTRSTSPTFTNGFLIRSALFVFRETRLAPEMSIALCAGHSDG